MRFIITCFLLCVCTLGVKAQNARYFEFAGIDTNVIYSNFEHIEFIDSRINRDYVGIVYKDGNNKLVPVWLHSPLINEMSVLVDSIIKNVPRQPYEVLVNVRNFFINEKNGAFEFHVGCYAKWDDGYWLVYRLDSAYRLKGAITQTKLAAMTNEVVDNFITTLVHLDLSRHSNVLPVTLEYIQDIDASEKKALPVFNVTIPQRGVYYTYNEFKNNSPRLTNFKADKGQYKLRAVYRPAVGNKLAKKIPRDSIYAVSDGEAVWIAAPHEYAQLNKRGLNFFFTASGYDPRQVEHVTLAAIFFGVVGGGLAALDKTMYEYKLNHLNGKFILLHRAANQD